ncbi:hypothetical protein [Actinomycetospora aeridis]|uniref:UDP-N-acetylglucosamine transferase subunit ALG13 n=1 Tax=Actinomycetospora aeridis TaxID=3129231 RepID=A0ABU8N692_9PSEU
MTPPTPTPDRPLLLVSVGSDHHPFGRLIDWVDEYLSVRTAAPPVRYVCQHGTSPAPRSAAAASAFVDHRELQSWMGQASATVVQGGPYSMIESMRNGRVPIAVPRRRALGECVDDHQAAFCRFLADRDEILLATSSDELFAVLDRVLDDPTAYAAPPWPYDEARAAAIRRFGSAVSGYRPRPRPRPGRWRRRPVVDQNGS